jgi:AbrB family looped-hinge helix DNA binding protein
MKTTITKKYQVHIPAEVRKQVGLVGHGRVSVRAENGKIIIEPLTDSFVSLGGTFTVERAISAEEIRNHIEYGKETS